MNLSISVKNVFEQINSVLQNLENDQYSRPCQNLFSASIGQHVRHIIELFQCLEKGYTSGQVNYDDRPRDTEIEHNRELACSLLQQVYGRLDRPAKALTIISNYHQEGIPTNYHRELLYNLEHTIHHMALMRVGLKEVANLEPPSGFGVAASTTQYQESCAQ